MAATPAKQKENLDELITMIKALERQKQSRPPLTFVKTGVSSASPPQFLINQDIIPEQKRTYTPTPLANCVANTDRQIGCDPLPISRSSPKRKKMLRKSKHLKKLKEDTSQKKKEKPPKRSNLYSEKRADFRPRRHYHRGVWRWLEELAIIMSKMSLFGLFLILLLLGSVFFGVGFLAALSNVQEKTSHPSWQQASLGHNQPGSSSGKMNPLLGAAGGIGSTLVDQKVAAVESKVGGGNLDPIIQKVPPSLKPFSLQMQNKFSQQTQAVIGGGGGAIKGAFRPSHFGSTPPPSNINVQPAVPTPPTPPPNAPVWGSAAAIQAQNPAYPRTSGGAAAYTPSQQAFRQASRVVQQQAAPQPTWQQPSAYAQPRSSGQPSSAQQVGQPFGAPSFPAQQPVSSGPVYQQPNPQGYYPQQGPASVPMQSQPYGVSQPYGYSQGSQGQPRMIGMG